MACVQRPRSHLLGIVINELADNAICFHRDNTAANQKHLRQKRNKKQNSTKQFTGLGQGQSAYAAMTEKLP